MIIDTIFILYNSKDCGNILFLVRYWLKIRIFLIRGTADINDRSWCVFYISVRKFCANTRREMR